MKTTFKLWNLTQGNTFRWLDIEICDQICKKGSSTHIQFYEIGNLVNKKDKSLNFLYLLTYDCSQC